MHLSESVVTKSLSFNGLVLTTNDLGNHALCTIDLGNHALRT